MDDITNGTTLPGIQKVNLLIYDSVGESIGD